MLSLYNPQFYTERSAKSKKWPGHGVASSWTPSARSCVAWRPTWENRWVLWPKLRCVFPVAQHSTRVHASVCVSIHSKVMHSQERSTCSSAVKWTNQFLFMRINEQRATSSSAVLWVPQMMLNWEIGHERNTHVQSCFHVNENTQSSYIKNTTLPRG